MWRRAERESAGRPQVQCMTLGCPANTINLDVAIARRRERSDEPERSL